MSNYCFLISLAIMLCGLSWGEMEKPSTEELRTEFHRLVQSNDQRNLGSIGSCGDGCESDNDCLSSLVCFQRNTGGPLPPCCVGSPPSDGRNYCVPSSCNVPSPTPAPTTPAPTRTPTTSAPVATPAPTIGPTRPPVTVVACFSGDTMVDVLEKGMIPMQELRVGDMILTKSNYELVYSFGHHHPTEEAEFLILRTDDNRALEVTSNHLIYLEGKSNPIRATSIQTGDRLQPFGVKVTEIQRVTKMGIFAPLTLGGSLIVNGNILASSYASLVQDVDEYAVFNNGSRFMAQHHLIHLVLTPLRMLCRVTLHNMCQAYDQNGMPPYVTKGIIILTWLNENCSTIAQVMVFILALLVFGTMMLIELLVFGEPLLVLAIICAGTNWYNKQKVSKKH